MANAGRSFVVVGGSIAGMGTALALARSGASVSLVERDVIPEAPGPEEAFALERPGVPQSHFLHAFLARMVHVLRERFPDVLDGLLEAGAQLSHPPVPGLEDITMLLARRSTVEWVMRRAVLAEPGIDCVSGRTVVALEGADRHVTGARLDDGTTIEGSVVACTGRRTDLASWVAPFGATIEEELVQSDLIYITRWYRAPELTMESSGILKDSSDSCPIWSFRPTPGPLRSPSGFHPMTGNFGRLCSPMRASTGWRPVCPGWVRYWPSRAPARCDRRSRWPAW